MGPVVQGWGGGGESAFKWSDVQKMLVGAHQPTVASSRSYAA